MNSQPVALVTGASKGIGRAISLCLARNGYEVIAVARSRTELDALAAEIVSGEGTCRTIVLDVTDFAAVTKELTGLHVDVLVNNAGIGIIKPMTELAPNEWH